MKPKRPRGIAGFSYWVKRGFPGEWYVMQGRDPSTGHGERIHTASNPGNACRMVDRLTSESFFATGAAP